MTDVNELDFTIEFKSDLTDKAFEGALMGQAESHLRSLAEEQDDLTGAAVAIREQAAGETPIYEATVVAYVRPENIAGKEKDESPEAALQGALDAVERQIRKKRERLAERWQQPQNDPVTQEMVGVVAAQEQVEEEIEDDEASGMDVDE